MKTIRGLLTVMLIFSLTVAFGFTIPDVAKTKSSFVIDEHDVKASSDSITFELKNVIYSGCIEHDRICSKDAFFLSGNHFVRLPVKELNSFVLIDPHQCFNFYKSKYFINIYSYLKSPFSRSDLPIKVGWK